jgi:hypothetical protein
MPTDRTVTATALDGRRMTLAELRAFVAEMDQAGAAETTPVGARVSWGGGLKELKASAARFGDPEKDRHHG